MKWKQILNPENFCLVIGSWPSDKVPKRRLLHFKTTLGLVKSSCMWLDRVWLKGVSYFVKQNFIYIDQKPISEWFQIFFPSIWIFSQNRLNWVKKYFQIWFCFPFGNCKTGPLFYFLKFCHTWKWLTLPKLWHKRSLGIKSRKSLMMKLMTHNIMHWPPK